MSKLKLNPIQNPERNTTFNSNFKAIEDYINEKLLNREGVENGQANYLEVDLDLNSHRILNVQFPVEDRDLATKGYVDERFNSIPATDGEVDLTGVYGAIEEGDQILSDRIDTLPTQADIDSAVQGLATTAYVDTEVGKIDTSGDGTTLTQSQLDDIDSIPTLATTTYVDNADSNLQSQIDNLSGGGSSFVPHYVRASDYGDGEAGLRAAWAESKYIELTPGATYTLNASSASDRRLLSNGQDVHIKGNGATLIQTSTEPVLALRGGWEVIQDVSTATSTSLTVTDGTAFSRGDVVKIVSDEPLPDFLSREKGEYAVVYDVSGNDLLFLQALRFSYDVASNCKVGKLRDSKIVVENINFGCTFSDEGVGPDPEPFIYLENAKGAEIRNVHSGFTWSDVIHLRDCYNVTIKDVHVKYGANQDNDWQSDARNYGIRVENSEMCILDRGSYLHGRHGIDFLSSGDSGLSYLQNGESHINGHGLARRCTVANWVADSTSNAAFSSHHGSEDIHWFNCVASGSRQAAFQIRGVGHSIVNCQAYNSPICFRAFIQEAYSGEAQTRRTTFKDCTAYDPHTAAYEIRDEAKDTIIDDCSCILTQEATANDPVRIIDVRNEQSTIYIFNFKFIALRDADTVDHIIEYRGLPSGTTSYLTIEGMDIITQTASESGMQNVVEAVGDGTVSVYKNNIRAYAMTEAGNVIGAFSTGNVTEATPQTL